MKIDPPPGPSRKGRLAQTLMSKDDVWKSLTQTLVAVEIQTASTEVSSHRSARKIPPWKESESA
jgi:hypothetical protein